MNATGDGDADSHRLHLGSVPLERISRAASEFTPEGESDIDEVDWQPVRLLLNDYASTVAHLRTAARVAERRVAGAAVLIQEVRVRIRQREKRPKAAARKKA